MKKALIFSTALLLSPAAYAADAIVEEIPAPVAVYDWSGLYLGINVGYGGGSFDHPFYVNADIGDFSGRVADGSLDITASGFVGGAQVGYNFQSGAFVYGVEADIQASNVKGELSGNLSINPDLTPISASAEIGTELDYFGTIRGRVGYAATDRFLIYGTGGFAYGRTESYVNASVNGSSVIDESVRNSRTGWTIGGGAEYAFTDNWSLKSEYLYTDLGTETLLNFSDLLGDEIGGALESDVAFHTVRVGLNYKF